MNRQTIGVCLVATILIAGCDSDENNVGIRGEMGPHGAQGAQGKKGEKGASCSVTDHSDGTKTLACEDGTSITLRDGKDGAAGPPGQDGLAAEPGQKGDKGEKGDQGESLTFDQLTAKQKTALTGPQGPKGDKGDKGDSFTYSDFTEKQLEMLKGDPATPELPAIEPFGIHAIDTGAATLSNGQAWAIKFYAPSTGVYDRLILMQGTQPNSNKFSLEAAIYHAKTRELVSNVVLYTDGLDGTKNFDWQHLHLPGLNATLNRNHLYYLVIRNSGNSWRAGAFSGASTYGRRMVYKRAIEALGESIVSFTDSNGNASKGRTPYFRITTDTFQSVPD